MTGRTGNPELLNEKEVKGRRVRGSRSIKEVPEFPVRPVRPVRTLDIGLERQVFSDRTYLLLSDITVHPLRLRLPHDRDDSPPGTVGAAVVKSDLYSDFPEIWGEATQGL